MRILSMYRIKAIPHRRWFVLHLYTSCFCNRNLTGSMVRCVSSPRSLFRFLINEQFLCINTQYLIKFSITLWSVSSLCTLQIRCHSIYVIVRPLPSFKNPHFQNAPKCTTFLMKMSFASEWKIISISNAEYLTSFWYRGPGKLGNGLLRIFDTDCLLARLAGQAHVM